MYQVFNTFINMSSPCKIYCDIIKIEVRFFLKRNSEKNV